jgi:parvulin-like peptidyl-prolyl isomerase
VTEAVLAHEAREAREAGIATRSGGEEVGAALRLLFERVTDDVAVPEADARAYYERNADLFRLPERRRVRELVLPDQAAARRAASRLAAGAPVEAGREHEVRRGEFAGPLEEAVFGAAVGAVIGPIRSEHGWHVALLERIVPEWRIPFAEVREGIEAELLVAVRARAFREWLEARRDALAVIEPAYEHPAHPVHGLPRHRH